MIYLSVKLALQVLILVKANSGSLGIFQMFYDLPMSSYILCNSVSAEYVLFFKNIC